MPYKIEIEQCEPCKRHPESVVRSKSFFRQKVAFSIRTTFTKAHSMAEFIWFANEKIDILREKHRISGVKPVVEHKQKTDENER